MKQHLQSLFASAQLMLKLMNIKMDEEKFYGVGKRQDKKFRNGSKRENTMYVDLSVRFHKNER